MPRPHTRRKIHRGLKPQVFGPSETSKGRRARLEMTLDGLEAVRLADLEGLYHQEAAKRMGVSRATFSRVLSAARTQLADAVVNGKAVAIEGGIVERHDETRWPCPLHGGNQRLGRGCRCDEGLPRGGGGDHGTRNTRNR